MYKQLTFKNINGSVSILSFNRPNSANALNSAMAEEIAHFFGTIDKATRAVIITGEGKNFCAGADLKERKEMDKSQWQSQHLAFEAAHHAIMGCEVPAIAAVNGAAFGGGLELAMACDFIYAADNARFALTETTLGIMPGLGGTQLLPRAIGVQLAKELIFCGRTFSAEDALRWGLINQIHPANTLIEAAVGCATTISNNAPLAVKAVKKSINDGASLPIDAALKCELSFYDTLINTSDRIEGINSFNEKRKPVFKGE
jgi:enoyl-CoA hydratase